MILEFLAKQYLFEQHHTTGKIEIASTSHHMAQRSNHLRQPTSKKTAPNIVTVIAILGIFLSHLKI